MESMNTQEKDQFEGSYAEARPQPKMRACLMCGESFESTGAGNRICQKCKSSQAWRTG